MDKPEVWTILIWILVLGCITTLSTGVWLSCTYVVRKFKKNLLKSKHICTERVYPGK